MSKFKKAKKILEKYNQVHLLNFFDELDKDKKELLLTQIFNIDFEEMQTLYENSKINNILSDKITPIPSYVKEEVEKGENFEMLKNIGEEVIKSGTFAVVTLAGGQGTRLGHPGPKGTFELDLPAKKKSLFEILCDGLKAANSQYSTTIPWYIMTSESNHNATIRFFIENDYFSYPKEHIFFFSQSKLPVTDIEGKLLLDEIYKIKEASNGNGNIYEAFRKNNLLPTLKEQNVKWIFICGIDNVLTQIVDPIFIGLTSYNKKEIASKTVYVEDNDISTAVFCYRNNKPGILLPEEITADVHFAKNEKGEYLYRDSNALCHLMTVEAFEKSCFIELPYHRAYKKNVFINSEGMKQIPESPNSFKFEKFIFDAFTHFDDLLLLRVEKNKEFAPIKDLMGMHSATKLYIKANPVNGDGEN